MAAPVARKLSNTFSCKQFLEPGNIKGYLKGFSLKHLEGDSPYKPLPI